MTTITKGFEMSISEEYILRVASSEEEGNKIAEFNELVHEEGISNIVKKQYNNPHSEILWFYIENRTTSSIISSLALMPLKWEIRGQEIAVAEMGYVGTHPDYRGQGLFGILNEYYNKAVIENGFVISALVGIPHFYRKYGYEYALTRLTGYYMPTANIPSQQIEHVNIRKATPDDLKFIGKQYREYNQKYAVYTAFDPKKFQFRLMNETCDLYHSITYIIEEERKPQAYFSIGSMEKEDQADIILVSDLTELQMIKMLQFVKTYNIGNIQRFKINVLRSSSLGKYLSQIAADVAKDWPWQIFIPDWKKLFDSFKPILESRLEHSIYSGISRTIKISNYNRTLEILIEEGKIIQINTVTEYPGKDVDLRIPSPFETKLFFSDKTVDDLKEIIPDTLIKQDSKLLITTLFPKISSNPFSYYQ